MVTTISYDQPYTQSSNADLTVLLGVRTLIAASETIYSPSSLSAFTRIVVNALGAAERDNAKALIAAKRFYFGVGGGVDAFRQELIELGGSLRIAWESTPPGVDRLILEATL